MSKVSAVNSNEFGFSGTLGNQFLFHLVTIDGPIPHGHSGTHVSMHVWVHTV